MESSERRWRSSETTAKKSNWKRKEKVRENERECDKTLVKSNWNISHIWIITRTMDCIVFLNRPKSQRQKAYRTAFQSEQRENPQTRTYRNGHKRYKSRTKRSRRQCKKFIWIRKALLTNEWLSTTTHDEDDDGGNDDADYDDDEGHTLCAGSNT